MMRTEVVLIWNYQYWTSLSVHQVLDKLRTFQVRCNQMEEINRSLEAEIESNKRDSNR